MENNKNKYNKNKSSNSFNKNKESNNNYRDFKNKNSNSYKGSSQSNSFADESSLIDTERSDVIAGRNAVMEAIKSDRQIDVIYVLQTAITGSINKIIGMAKDKRIVIKTVTHQKLDNLSGGVSHQGIVAVASIAEYVSVEDILNIAKEKNQDPFIIICDEIEDPHNLGAIIRTAEAAGAHGVIIPKRRSATLTQVVYKTSAGAASVLAVAKVSNLVSAIVSLQKAGVWIYATDMDGQNWSDVDYKGGVGLIIGSEGKGIGKMVKEKADFVISLPMYGQINSLNASVAGGICMYEIARQKNIT